jgi:site-specific recombinase XerD
MRNGPSEFCSEVKEPMLKYLEYHRALGKRFETERRALCMFDHYVAALPITSLAAITPKLVTEFVCSRNRAVPKSHNHLVGVLRRWFTWLVGQELLVSSPLQLKPKRETAGRPPFLFTPEQARMLLAAASRLRDNPRGAQRGITYRMIFALLYGLGLRIREVAHLQVEHIDWSRNLLLIQETKFFKSRLIPFGPKMGAQLREYLTERAAAAGPLAPSDPVFSFGADKSRPINPYTVTQVFLHLWPKLGLRIPAGVAPPRLHCLRHSFAVETLLRWYRGGEDPNDKLLLLSTFMGHVHPASTAVYLTITAELRQVANRRFERFATPLLKEVLS